MSSVNHPEASIRHINSQLPGHIITVGTLTVITLDYGATQWTRISGGRTVLTVKTVKKVRN